MKVLRIVASLFSIALVALPMGLRNANAEISPQPKASLHSSASHAFVGTIKQTYDRTEMTERYKYTYGVAEVAVERVDKGGEIAAGDRVFVRYWRKRWMGDGPPPPQHFGHGNIPAKEDVAEIYVKGDRKSGFDALSPNGFFKVTSPVYRVLPRLEIDKLGLDGKLPPNDSYEPSLERGLNILYAQGWELIAVEGGRMRTFNGGGDASLDIHPTYIFRKIRNGG